LSWNECFFFSSRRRHTRSKRDWSSDVCSSDLSCGSVDSTGLYKAPAAVPTAAPSSTTAPVNAAGIVTVFAFSKVDNARIAQAARSEERRVGKERRFSWSTYEQQINRESA